MTVSYVMINFLLLLIINLYIILVQTVIGSNCIFASFMEYCTGFYSHTTHTTAFLFAMALELLKTRNVVLCSNKRPPADELYQRRPISLLKKRKTYG